MADKHPHPPAAFATPVAPAARLPGGIIAWRGTGRLQENALQDHVASLVRMENISVLLGSGASVCAGGKTLGQVWQQFREQSKAELEWLKKQRFISDPDVNINPEQLLSSLHLALPEWQRGAHPELKDLNDAIVALYRAVIRGSFLNPDFWRPPYSLHEKRTGLEHHGALLRKLCNAREPGQPDPWIFTLNYDLSVEWAAEVAGLRVQNGFSGIHGRTFTPHDFDLGYQNTSGRGEARFGTYGIYLAKIHGSLSWSVTSQGDIRELQCDFALHKLQEFLDGKTEALPSVLVYPSQSKFSVVCDYVHSELMRRLSQQLARPQSFLLVSGYSFSDEHINRLLESALLNPTLQILIYLPEFQPTADPQPEGGISRCIKRMLELQSPQVTLVGGGARAFFDRCVQDLPEPIWEVHQPCEDQVTRTGRSTPGQP